MPREFTRKSTNVLQISQSFVDSSTPGDIFVDVKGDLFYNNGKEIVPIHTGDPGEIATDHVLPLNFDVTLNVQDTSAPTVFPLSVDYQGNGVLYFEEQAGGVGSLTREPRTLDFVNAGIMSTGAYGHYQGTLDISTLGLSPDALKDLTAVALDSHTTQANYTRTQGTWNTFTEIVKPYGSTIITIDSTLTATQATPAGLTSVQLPAATVSISIKGV